MKVASLGIAFLAWVNLSWGGEPSSAAVQQSQQAAVQAYPELGVENSPLNSLFRERYSRHQFDDPAYFKNDKWPMQLARECVQELPQVEKEKAAKRAAKMVAWEARRQFYKDVRVPEPDTTPFDADAQERKKYLAAYQSNYRISLLIGRPIRLIICGKVIRGSPDIEGSSAGASAAYRDYPEAFINPDSPDQVLQPIAGTAARTP